MPKQATIEDLIKRIEDLLTSAPGGRNMRGEAYGIKAEFTEAELRTMLPYIKLGREKSEADLDWQRGSP